MGARESQSELMAVLDYILNRCTIREIDAVESAVERRRRDFGSGGGATSLDPARAARSMTESVNASLGASMESIRTTFRQFAGDLIRKEAPELTDEQIADLVDGWIPSGSPANDLPDTGKYRGRAQKGRVNGIPREALRSMVAQFVDYSVGAMSVSDEAALRDAIGDWTSEYWKKFPQEIQAAIKAFLTGKLSGEEFGEELDRLLG